MDTAAVFSCKVDLIVTGDNDLLSPKRCEGVLIIAPEEAGECID